MATLNLNIAIQVTNGPQINVNRAREIEAFDKVDVLAVGGDGHGRSAARQVRADRAAPHQVEQATTRRSR